MSAPSSTSSSLKSKPTAGADDEKKSSKRPGHISGNNMILRFRIPTVAYSTKQRWKIIYPIYISKKHTLVQGRRVPHSKAIERPTIVDIAEIAIQLDLPYVIEQDKAYPRDYMQLGRVRVELLDDDGKPLNPKIKNKKQFLSYCCDNIEKLKNRPARVEKLIKLEQQEQAFFQSEKEKAAEKKEQSQKESEASGGGNKKKNKNKKKK